MISLSEGIVLMLLAFVAEPCSIRSLLLVPRAHLPRQRLCKKPCYLPGEGDLLHFFKRLMVFLLNSKEKKIMIMLRWSCISSKRVSNDWLLH